MLPSGTPNVLSNFIGKNIQMSKASNFFYADLEKTKPPLQAPVQEVGHGPANCFNCGMLRTVARASKFYIFKQHRASTYFNNAQHPYKFETQTQTTNHDLDIVIPVWTNIIRSVSVNWPLGQDWGMLIPKMCRPHRHTYRNMPSNHPTEARKLGPRISMITGKSNVSDLGGRKIGFEAIEQDTNR